MHKGHTLALREEGRCVRGTVECETLTRWSLQQALLHRSQMSLMNVVSSPPQGAHQWVSLDIAMVYVCIVMFRNTCVEYKIILIPGTA